MISVSMLCRTLVNITVAAVCVACISGCDSDTDRPPSVLGDLAYTEEKEELEYTLLIPEDDRLVPYLVLTDDYNNTGNCLLLRKYLLDETSIFNVNAIFSGYYENSEIDQMLEQDFLRKLSPDASDLIVPTEIPITARESLHGGGDSVIEIERKVFLLSATEVGKPGSRTILTEGEALKYFYNSEQRIACFETGEPISWWLRTPSVAHDNVVCGVGNNGTIGIGGVGSFGEKEYENGVRPAFCMPADIPIYPGDDGYYVLVAPGENEILPTVVRQKNYNLIKGES